MRITVHDFTGRREAEAVLQEIRGAMLHHVGELGRVVIAPGDDIGEAVVLWNEHVVEMVKLIDLAAETIGSETSMS